MDKNTTLLSYFRYIKTLTTPSGILQHSFLDVPDLRFGYSIDDNARALIACCQCYDRTRDESMLALIHIYVTFLRFAQDDDGLFHNYLGYDNNWRDDGDNKDFFARGFWAMCAAYYYLKKNDIPLYKTIEPLIQKALPHIGEVSFIHTASFSLLGMYYLCLAAAITDDVMGMQKKIVQLADILINAYEQSKDSEWQWFADTIDYENGRLPQALFLAYEITKNDSYKEVATSTLNFLLDTIYEKKEGFFHFIGSNGWYAKGKRKTLFDEQPVEAGNTIEVCMLAAKILENKEYEKKAHLAYDWYFGKNSMHQTMYNTYTGGIYDGITEDGINKNQGAESIVSFLLGYIALIA